MTEPTPFDKLAFTWEAAFTAVDAAEASPRGAEPGDIAWMETMRPQLENLRRRNDAGEDLEADFDTMMWVMANTQTAMQVLSRYRTTREGADKLAEFERLRAQSHTLEAPDD
ncbi:MULTISPECIES: hypothetical protein [Gordonia]|uniref:Uncharacterized protein n=2 Tax=Gordonia TaxID=2053 RepID=L7LFA6_9ACTN|nr:MULTISPECIES: hypothetical protein [Gordonia]AUH68914.1 hypothetical protein CXX93_11830 [Gordonia sp. YC-JH1]KJR06103.1 hypothetical protein UG54_14610 [Gordonia sihwensis]KXT56368.1 hypothetical protein Y710_14020 [Gordonia sp. QH-12]MBY4570789.1 hypothetical protein [Gordonia sihwensis]WFN91194.1 hypothetical protein P5P27_10300 [Gordonia sihwensis]